MSIFLHAAQDPSCILALSADRGGAWWSTLTPGTVDTGVYGVLYDPSVAAAAKACTRAVYEEKTDRLYLVNAHNRLPAHRFRRCVMDDLAARHVAYYLDSGDSTRKADGSPAVLTGADGDVMVEISVTHWRVETLADGRILYLVSDHPFQGSEIHPFFYVSPDGKTARTQYVGAYRSTLCDGNGFPLLTDEVAAAPPAYSTGRRARSIAGAKPWTHMTQNIHRAAAANNGAHGINALFKQFLLLMMLIEGSSFDTQSTVSPGFLFASEWNYAFTRLAGRANFGNGTGSVPADPVRDAAITWRTADDAQKVVQFSYRGIENPYGEIWEFEDGAVADVANGRFYHTAAESRYSDVKYLTDYENSAHRWPQLSLWPKTWDARTFFPLSGGGGNNTYSCDYFYTAAADARAVMHGGSLFLGTFGGAGSLSTDSALTLAFTTIGARLAC